MLPDVGQSSREGWGSGARAVYAARFSSWAGGHLVVAFGSQASGLF